MSFDNPLGDALDAVIDFPTGPVRAFALFAHCFTCGKNLQAANRIALLATGELDHALHALAVQLFVESGGELSLDASGHPAPLERSIRDRLVASQPQLAALMSFGTSSLYPTLLRRRVTLPHR